MRKILVVFLFGFLLSGCGLSQPPVVEDINETVVGVVSRGTGEGLYLLKTADQTVIELHDGGASLAGWVGKSVEVTGQYSGTTLYVDQVVGK